MIDNNTALERVGIVVVGLVNLDEFKISEFERAEGEDNYLRMRNMAMIEGFCFGTK